MRNLRFLDQGESYGRQGQDLNLNTSDSTRALTLKHFPTTKVTRPVYVIMHVVSMDFLAWKFSFNAPFSRWSLIPPLPLSVGWSYWLTSNKHKKAEVMGCAFRNSAWSLPSESLSQRKPTAMSWVHSSNSVEKPIRWGTMAACQQSCDRAI